MAQKTPVGGVRRSYFEFRNAGVLTTAAEIRVDVYVDGQTAPDPTLSAAATSTCAVKAGQPGLYVYSYSVAGIAAGTHLLDLISVRVTTNDPLRGAGMADTVVDGVISNPVNTVATDHITLKLSGSCC